MRKQSYNLLVVEDDKSAQSLLVNYFKTEGFNALGVESCKEALHFIENFPVDLVLLDIRLPDGNGKDLLRVVKEHNPLIAVIMVSALSDVETVVETLKNGAEDYVVKPINLEVLLDKVKAALQKYEQEIEFKAVEEIENFEITGFLYKSPKTKEVLVKALKASKSNAPCLLLGETGTGKTLIARSIHRLSRRSNGPFIDVHLQAIPETLLEAELFGYKKGAFTGAEGDYDGLIMRANGGTLFLDEIGELKKDLQVKLLKVLEEKRVRPIGDTREKPVDFRLITATNKNLLSLIKDGFFREDLYYRINIIEIYIPPLRERKEDIPVLVDYFLKRYGEMEGKRIEGISREAMNILMRYPFPGNVRELSNIIERACVMTSNNIIDITDLPESVRDYFSKDVPPLSLNSLGENLFDMVKEFERRIIINALQEENFVKSRAARRLGISERVLRYKMKVLGIDDGKMHSKGE